MIERAFPRRNQNRDDKPDKKQDDMRLLGAGAFELVRHRGIGARHQSRKQGDGSKRKEMEKFPHAEETEYKSYNKSYGDRQQKEQTSLEFPEKAAERVRQLFV